MYRAKVANSLTQNEWPVNCNSLLCLRRARAYNNPMRSHCIALLFALLLGAKAADKIPYFQIEVVDEQTGRGVPLVELRAVNNLQFWTDSNGIIAFYEPAMMDREVFFHIQSDGYTYPADFFKNHGLKLRPKAGGHETIKIKRANIAERLYRVTGEGIYRDSVLTGRNVPIRQPLLNAEITGQDTVIVTPYHGKLFWFWGDTDRLSYPLGNFAATGAMSEFPGSGGLDPKVGVDLTYFTNKDGFAKQMCANFGPGLHWIEGVFTVADPSGRERLVTRVSSQEGLRPAYAWHFAVWNDEKQQFDSIIKWDIHWGHDSAHTFRAKVGGQEYVYLYPNYRVRAQWHSVTNLAEYESFTCLDTGKKAMQWKWVKGADRLNPSATRRLVRDGVIRAEDSWIRTEGGMERGSVAWNDYRKRWIMIGSGKAGEIWYAEAKAPTGPWVGAVKVLSHEAYNFYNPTQHPEFDQDGGRVIYFEGTYTAEFSSAKEKTPRYNYNQIMYRLDLGDLRLKVAEAPEPFEGEKETVPVR